MFSMIYERSSYPEIFAVTSDQRAAFKQSSMPLTNWIVWAAPFSDDCCPAIYMELATSREKGGPVSSAGTPDNTDNICRMPNFHFGAGGIAFLTFSAAADYGFESLSKLVSMFVSEAGLSNCGRRAARDAKPKANPRRCATPHAQHTARAAQKGTPNRPQETR